MTISDYQDKWIILQSLGERESKIQVAEGMFCDMVILISLIRRGIPESHSIKSGEERILIQYAELIHNASPNTYTYSLLNETKY